MVSIDYSPIQMAMVRRKANTVKEHLLDDLFWLGYILPEVKLSWWQLRLRWTEGSAYFLGLLMPSQVGKRLSNYHKKVIRFSFEGVVAKTRVPIQQL